MENREQEIAGDRNDSGESDDSCRYSDLVRTCPSCHGVGVLFGRGTTGKLLCKYWSACVHILPVGETRIEVSGSNAEDVEGVAKALLTESKKKGRGKQPLNIKLGDGTLINLGDNHVGDKIHIAGDAIGSAVGTNASVKVRDIITAVRNSGLEDDLKHKLAQAAELLANLEIAEGDKSDAADDLGKLTVELEKPTKDVGRIKRIWNRIKDAAPTAAAVLASAVSLAKLLHGTP